MDIYWLCLYADMNKFDESIVFLKKTSLFEKMLPEL